MATDIPGSGPSLAPSVEPSEVDVDALEALCVGHAPDQPELANCLAVIHVYIVPGSAPEPPFPPAPSLGFTYIDQNLSVTLLGVDWATPGPDGASSPDRQWVSMLVHYRAHEDADFSAKGDWQAKDQNGNGADSIDAPKAPALGDGKLRAAHTAEGWLTFDFPAGVTSVEITYRDGLFGDDHRWVVNYDPSAGPVVQATPMPTPERTPTVAPTLAPMPEPTPTPTPTPTPPPGLGFTYADPDIKVTLLRVDWDARSTFLKPAAGKQWVSILVRYDARTLADFNAMEDWKIVDNDGFDGGAVFFSPKDPELTDGHLRKGQKVQGWVTFEFAKGVKWLTVTYINGLFGDERTWVVRRPRG